jgi:small subunit ribosomal protein S7
MRGGGTIKNSQSNIGVKRSPFVYFSTSNNNFPLKKEKDLKKDLKKTFKKDSVWWNFSSPLLGDEKPSGDQRRENSYTPYSYLSSSVWRLRTGPLGSLLASPNIDFKTRYGLKTKSYPDAYFVTKEYICRKIINCICKNGKKRLAYGIFNSFILELRNRNVFSPREYVTKAVLSLRPLATLRKNIVSGVVKKIPSSINMQSSVSVALNWFVRSARDRTERTMVERLVGECLDILSNRKCLSKNKKLEHYKIIHANRYLIYNKKDSHFKSKAVVATQQPVLEKKVIKGYVKY